MLTELLIDLIAAAISRIILASPIIIIVLLIVNGKKSPKKKPQNKQTNSKGPYGTGWIWNNKTQKWEYAPARKPEKNINPTFEEWRAQKEQQEINSTPANSKTEQGTYRYDYIHIPDEETSFNQTYTTSAARSTAAPKEPEPLRQELKHDEPPKTGYEEAYEVTPLLTYNESRNFATLQTAANRKGYIICPKVRLADIITPRSGDKYYSHFGKIKSKHVDFAICNSKMKVLAVIELDDNSHNRPDRIERDNFVNSILEANGIKVIHTRHITDDILDDL